MPRPRYPADTPRRCVDCGAACCGVRCSACHHDHWRGRPKRGVPVRAPDGREWPSVSALTREWGTAHQNAYNHMRWNGDHWLLVSEPNPANIGAQRDRRPQPRRRIRHAAAD